MKRPNRDLTIAPNVQDEETPLSLVDKIEHSIIEQQEITQLLQGFFTLCADANSSLDWCIEQSWDGLRVIAGRLHKEQQETIDTIDRLWERVKDSAPRKGGA